jgi:hypothetical protein
MSRWGTVENFTQRGKFRQVQAKWDAWKIKWDKGAQWGVVGGGPLQNLPKTALDQILEHGEDTYARDQARSIEGLGLLIESISEILDGDAILYKHKAQLEKDTKQMKDILKRKDWNPRNIKFHTVVAFKETEDETKPSITRGVVYGHYRTEAYNDYVAWALDHKEGFKGQMATAQPEWTSKKKGEAKPPMWQAISEESEDSIMIIARMAIDAVKKIKPGDDTVITVENNSKGPPAFATIPSVIEHVKKVINDPSIYPKGKSRAPVKDRLNAAFSNHVYAIANEDEAKILEVARGFEEVVGLEKIKQIRFKFPSNNLALNRMIKEVLGDEINTHQKPGSSTEKDSENYAPTGLVLKSWTQILRKC